MTQAPKQNSQWLSPSRVPFALERANFVLEPLAEEHAALDFKALMSCRERLRRELQWGKWPPADFTIELNRADLADHFGEFSRGEAFAYTVLSPGRTRCLGCIYVERCTEIDGAQLAFWVIDDALDIETELVTQVLDWIHETWAIERVLIPMRKENTRGQMLARECGFEISARAFDGPLAEHLCFLSESRDR